jgi:hypothetical protein
MGPTAARCSSANLALAACACVAFPALAAKAAERPHVVLVADPAPTLATVGKLKAIVLGPPSVTAATVELRAAALEIAGPANSAPQEDASCRSMRTRSSGSS